MDKFQFVGFEPTPGEKHVGIATVRVYGQVVIVLRFKIVSRKDGTGHFPNAASYKMPNRMPGEEYEECFMLDSRSDHAEMTKFIMHHFHQWQAQQQPSVFAAQQSMQPRQSKANEMPKGSVPFIQQPEYQQTDFMNMPDEAPPF